MLPTKSNHTKDGCVTTSSNCVIWQGPDLNCINLCTGDTVSDVIAKLALELCDIMDQISIDGFNVSCLGAVPTPINFHALVQLLITRICALEAGSNGGGGGIITGGCPDCMVALPTCLQYTNPATQSLVTQLNLNDYAALVATRLCNTIADIEELQATVLQNSTDITNLNIRVTSLESNASTSQTLPNVNISCITGVTSTPLSTAVVNIANEVCALEQTLGSTTDILNAALKQCTGLDSSPALSQPGVMSSLPGWVSAANTISETITNLWLTVCDMRGAIRDIQTNCCGSLCSSISVNLSVTVTTQLNFFFTGVIPAGFTNCDPTGTAFTIVGDGYSGVATVFNVIPYIGNSFGFPIPAGLNTNANFTVTGNLCLQDENGSQCQSVLSYTYTSTLACPTVTLTPGDTTVGYSFLNTVAAPIYYNIQLYNSTGTILGSSQLKSNPAIGSVTGSFAGLALGTGYQVRVQYSIDNKTFSNCPFVSTMTTTPGCTAIDERFTTASIAFITT